MIDTIVIFIDRIDIDDPFDVLQHLNDVREKMSGIGGYCGTYKNFNVSVDDGGVKIDGSLSKFYLPSNVYTLQRKDVEMAVDRLSNELGIDVGLGIVWRLDISTILPMVQQPREYYKLLGDRPRFKRVIEKNSLYYNTKRKKLLFYDKILEAESKGATIPGGLNERLLRYELRFVKDTQQQLKRILGTKEAVRLRMLYEADKYRLLVRQWRDEFKLISKNNIFKDMKTKFETPKEAFNVILSIIIQTKGGQDLVDECMAMIKANQSFNDPKQYTRLKDMLNKLIQGSPTANNELLRELEKKIDDVAKYSR